MLGKLEKLVGKFVGLLIFIPISPHRRVMERAWVGRESFTFKSAV